MEGIDVLQVKAIIPKQKNIFKFDIAQLNDSTIVLGSDKEVKESIKLLKNKGGDSILNKKQLAQLYTKIENKNFAWKLFFLAKPQVFKNFNGMSIPMALKGYSYTGFKNDVISFAGKAKYKNSKDAETTVNLIKWRLRNVRHDNSHGEYYINQSSSDQPRR